MKRENKEIGRDYGVHKWICINAGWWYDFSLNKHIGFCCVAFIFRWYNMFHTTFVPHTNNTPPISPIFVYTSSPVLFYSLFFTHKSKYFHIFRSLISWFYQHFVLFHFTLVTQTLSKFWNSNSFCFILFIHSTFTVSLSLLFPILFCSK